MSKCRDILLEVKRRLGDVNAPVPGEVDMMAFLNRALRGAWNFGARLWSPVLQKIVRVTEATGYSSTLSEEPFTVISAYDHTNARNIYPVDNWGGFLADTLGDTRKYRVVGTTFEVYPQSGDEGIDISICYVPEFTPLTDRDDDIPFSSRLDNIIIEWALSLITKGDPGTGELDPGLITHASTLSEYFRGTSPRYLTGYGPW